MVAVIFVVVMAFVVAVIFVVFMRAVIVSLVILVVAMPLMSRMVVPFVIIVPRVIIMTVVTLVTFMISVIMGFERNAAAVGQQADTLYVLQGQTFGPLRQTAHRLFEPRGQRRADPDHQIGLGHRARLAGAHGIAVGRRAGRDDQIGAACTLHDHRHQRMYRRDIGGDTGHLCMGQTGREK